MTSTTLIGARTDEELMLVYQAGDRQAFDELYGRYAKPIHNFFRRTAPRPDAVDDLFQKTFLHVHTGRHRYRPQAPFRHWIFAIARNVLRDDVRHQRRRPVVNAAEFDERVAMEGTRSQPGSQSTEVSLMVSEAVSALPLSQREVIVLSRYQDMSYAEIGEVLGISENAVKQRAFQAMQNLRRSLNVDRRSLRKYELRTRTLCHEIRVDLPALVAGQLDKSARAALEQHLSFCPGCQFEWHEHELVWRCVRQCEDVDPPQALRDRVRQAIAQLE